MIAGPCAAESYEQVMTTARAIAKLNIPIFRAGVWKPRTKPGCFEGVGYEALNWLSQVKFQTGLKVAIEVATPAQAKAAVDAGIDVLWIGARTTVNPFAVQEVADELSQISDYEKNRILVLIKNPVSYDVELWAGAVERIKGSGVKQIGIIHRGFTPCGYSPYRNTPSWNLAAEIHRRYPEMPFICDPSHMAGKASLVPGLSQTALNIGFDGLMVEAHYLPETALTDKQQQLSPDELAELNSSLVIRTETATENLSGLREEIDGIDSQLIDLLARRMNVSKAIGEVKQAGNLPIIQPERCSEVLASRNAECVKLGLDEDFSHKLFGLIHDESVRQQLSE